MLTSLLYHHISLSRKALALTALLMVSMDDMLREANYTIDASQDKEIVERQLIQYVNNAQRAN